MVDAFCDQLELRGYSRETIRVSRCYLAMLAAWLQLQHITRPTDVTRRTITDYQRHLHDHRKADGKTLSLYTQGAAVGPIRRFYTWAVDNDLLHDNPTAAIVLPRREQRLPRAVLTAEEAELTLATPDIHTPIGLRDRAILETFYATGMRRSELSRLTLPDIDRQRRTVLIREGKGNKDRFIPISQRALAWIALYTQRTRPLWAREPDDLHVFLSREGYPLTPHRYSGIVRRYVKDSGINKHGACHMFRHTLATLMLEGGADIRYVQQMLGHSNLTSTQIYTHVSVATLQAVYTASFPGADGGEIPAESN
ncbi:MAG: tyrosine-type recombinase/integrase [Actinomycetia bacterium]|nr:tyrosine-type recombinase/integrase [Actinomycetes bacterium]